jgi:hypothetical protein
LVIVLLIVGLGEATRLWVEAVTAVATLVAVVSLCGKWGRRGE